MRDLRDYKKFLLALSKDEFALFVSKFGGDARAPEHLIAWVNSPEREKAICERIQGVFDVEILTAEERHELIAKGTAAATERQAYAAERANETAEKALRIARQGLYWTKLVGIVAALAFIVSLFSLLLAVRGR